MWDCLWINANLATMEENGDRYGAVRDAAIAVDAGRLAWLGPVAHLGNPLEKLAGTIRDAGGRWITPGLIDCHTHLVHGGNRALEFEQRLTGVSYEEIARAGGGILSTVMATRAASEADLVESAARRLQGFLNEGVTTLEIKSGYGLDIENEMKMLRAARALEDIYAVTIKTSFLGAHALPPEYKTRADDYIDLVCEKMLPAISSEGLADAVDLFMEKIAFDEPRARKVIAAAKRHGLPVKLHADQLSDMGGAGLAAEQGALSADHIEYASLESLDAMARSGTVAVLLPGAFYFLREKQYPPVAALRSRNIPIAIASDANPGSSPTGSLLLMLNMATTLFRMTPEEALAGVTLNAAKALGLENRIGSLAVGKQADFVLWDIAEPAELSYRMGSNPCAGVVKSGQAVR